MDYVIRKWKHDAFLIPGDLSESPGLRASSGRPLAHNRASLQSTGSCKGENPGCLPIMVFGRGRRKHKPIRNDDMLPYTPLGEEEKRGLRG